MWVGHVDDGQPELKPNQIRALIAVGYNNRSWTRGSVQCRITSSMRALVHDPKLHKACADDRFAR
jgi:hypothetical protein